MSGEAKRGAPFFETNEGLDGIARDVYAAAAVALLRKDGQEALRVCEMLGRLEGTYIIGRRHMWGGGYQSGRNRS